jgi:hypothetical protein
METADEGNGTAIIADVRAQFGDAILDDIIRCAYLTWVACGKVRGIGARGAVAW